MNIVGGYLQNIGRQSDDMKTLSNAGRITSNQLTLFAEASHVSHFPQPGSEEASKMTVTSGLRCLELYKNAGQIGLFVKMLLGSMAWGSTQSFLIWRPQATKLRRRLKFRLHLLGYKPWNGMFGLLQRPMCSDAYGAKKTRTRTLEKRGNFREMIRECTSDGIYPKPDFVEWLKGYPEGWTDISETD